MMTVAVNQKSPGWTEKFKQMLKRQSGREVAVGFPKGTNNIASPHYENGASILDVAIWNNFGTTRGIPERPFMTNAAPRLHKMFNKMVKDTQKAVNAGRISEETVLKAAALEGEAIVRQAIDAIVKPPNAPQTLKRKKSSSKPLIDSGAMRKYVKGVVRGRTR